ncbi:hypothetical protein ACFXHA_43105 [Nocardia sp. NPDC059240]|uniref:hypothetical protein n=1 Tax=Nocardia sp. NPDC059240 TaxID=3346786 RepID=UPI0036ABEF67
MNRRPARHDPTPATVEKAITEYGQSAVLAELLRTLPSEQARIVRLVVDGFSLEEVAQEAGRRVDVVRASFTAAVAALTAQWTQLTDQLGIVHDVEPVEDENEPNTVAFQAMTSGLSLLTVVWCRRHMQWTFLNHVASYCNSCPCEVPVSLNAASRGPGLYCSDACRQAAYRDRRARLHR